MAVADTGVKWRRQVYYLYSSVSSAVRTTAGYRRRSAIRRGSMRVEYLCRIIWTPIDCVHTYFGLTLHMQLSEPLPLNWSKQDVNTFHAITQPDWNFLLKVTITALKGTEDFDFDIYGLPSPPASQGTWWKPCLGRVARRIDCAEGSYSLLGDAVLLTC